MLYKSVAGWIFQKIGIGSMRFSILRYAEELVTQSFCLWKILQGILRNFKGRMLWWSYFFSNLTNWKQPCDLGVRSAEKKRYKFLLLKEIMSFCKLCNDSQQLLKKECCKFCRGSVGVSYGRLPFLLDVANYIKEEWTKLLMKLSKIPS